jgi:hypothetical protein
MAPELLNIPPLYAPGDCSEKVTYPPPELLMESPVYVPAPPPVKFPNRIEFPCVSKLAA